MELDEQIKEAVKLTIAQTILEKLPTDARDALLQKAIADTIGRHDFRNAVSKVAAEKAASVAAEMVESDEWHQSITEAINNGFHDYLVELRAAVPTMLKEMMHGKDGSSFSTRVADILRSWPKAEAE